MNGIQKALLFPVLILSFMSLSAEDSSWRVQAELSAAQPGLVEAVLPPALHLAAQDALDLRVLSPGVKPLALELYRKKTPRDEYSRLRIQSTKLLDNGRFSWVGTAEKPTETRLMRVYLTADDYVAKVNVFALVSGSWKLLAGNAAVYRLEGTSRADISIPAGVYSSFKLEFISFDTKYLQKPAPVETIEIQEASSGVAYAEAGAVAVPQRTDDNVRVVLSVTLPGSGLTVKEIQLTTTEPFLGAWSLEQEVIENGKRTFAVWKEGRIAALEKGSSVLHLGVDETAQSRIVRLTLIPDAYFGKVLEWKTVFFLPRLVFNAEAAGQYRVQAGCGDAVQILDEPSSVNREAVQSGVWGTPEVNPAWKPADLVKKYALSGGPFEAKKYTWNAPLALSGGGYYRLVLNEQASLEGNVGGLRIARGGRQVPYFIGQGDTVEIALEAEEKYNEAANTTTWDILIPRVSTAWGDLILEAQGVFSRKLLFDGTTEIPWTNAEAKGAVLRVPLSSLQQGNSRIRLEIENGDNKALVISKIQADYYAPALCFLAEAGDGFVLYGGNSAAKEARYDLDLVQDDLLTQEPLTVAMGDCAPTPGNRVFSDIGGKFARSKWGLYAVLALVTLVLLFVIAKLFPKLK